MSHNADRLANYLCQGILIAAGMFMTAMPLIKPMLRAVPYQQSSTPINYVCVVECVPPMDLSVPSKTE